MVNPQRRSPIRKPNSVSLSLGQRWRQFARERFSPWIYIPMISLFVAMNGSFGSQITESNWKDWKLLLVLPLILSFFFRMRLFDEIKDYRTDLKVNPQRPLPRGLLRLRQVKTMIIALIGIEALIASLLGGSTFLVYVSALCFSLLMYNEFFLSDFLRHRLTTYAVSHTFVSVLLGVLVSVALVGHPIQGVTAAILPFYLMNWTLFNLFEFARKSFANKEERPAVPTYSLLFGVSGAWLLSVSQIVILNILFQVATHHWSPLLGATSLLYVGISSYYPIAKSLQSARVFRHLTSVVLLIFQLILIYELR